MAIHGKNAHFTIDDSGGTPRDISAALDNIDYPDSVDTAETSTFGNARKTYAIGLVDGTISCSGVYDATTWGYLNGVLGQEATLTFVYGPAGSGSGSLRLTGECNLTSLSTPATISDANRFSADFIINQSTLVTADTFP
jgi:hypothetical protein